MILDLNGVSIEFTNPGGGVKAKFYDSYIKEIIKCLTVLFTTPKGTVVWDRDFGIDWSFLDKPINVAKALLTSDYINQVRKYEPRVRVVAVKFDYDSLSGRIKPRVVVEYARS